MYKARGEMNRPLSSRLFHIPMIVVLSLVAAMAGVLFLTGHEYRAAVLVLIAAALFYLLYGFFIVPRIYTNPARRLVQAVQSLAKGGTDVTWGTGFRGELLDLRMALESLAGTRGSAGDPGVDGAAADV